MPKGDKKYIYLSVGTCQFSFKFDPELIEIVILDQKKLDNRSREWAEIIRIETQSGKFYSLRNYDDPLNDNSWEKGAAAS